jgi:quinoprotein glucose dehydrogenase
MPAFPQLTAEAISGITAFLVNGEEKEVVSAIQTSLTPSIKYNIDGYNKLLDPDGYPGITPPWGTLTAINLNEGKIAWQIPLGEYPELAAKGMRNTGTENYGGPAVTSNGLLIIAATIRDNKIRIFDKKTGKELWQAELPAAGTATPAVYSVNGHEFIVIACGGGKWGAKSGGKYVAFALPSGMKQQAR